MKATLQSEISLVAHSLNAGVQAVNWGAVTMPTWAHLLVMVFTTSLAAGINRQSVTPNVKIGA